MEFPGVDEQCGVDLGYLCGKQPPFLGAVAVQCLQVRQVEIAVPPCVTEVAVVSVYSINTAGGIIDFCGPMLHA